MANAVAVLIHETALPIPFKVANGTAVPKGTLMVITDSSGPLAAASSADNDIFIGIAAEEKIASDGKTKLGIYMQGIFKLESNGTTTIGKNQVIKALNEVADSTAADNDLGYIVGKALETATNGETFLCAVGML